MTTPIGSSSTAFSRHSVKVDALRLRPAEVNVLLGDPGKAERKIGCKSEIKLAELAAEMVDADIARHHATLR